MAPTRALIIDDSKVTTFVLRSALESHGFTVMTAGSGEEGLELAATFAPDVVVLDRGLPRMLGEEVCGRLRELDATRDACIVMLTATQDEAVRREALARGVDAFMVKPIKAPDLVAQIQGLRSARRASQPAPARETQAPDDVSPNRPAALDIDQRRVATARALIASLETVVSSSSLSIKDRGGVDAALDLARSLLSSLRDAREQQSSAPGGDHGADKKSPTS